MIDPHKVLRDSPVESARRARHLGHALHAPRDRGDWVHASEFSKYGYCPETHRLAPPPSDQLQVAAHRGNLFHDQENRAATRALNLAPVKWGLIALVLLTGLAWAWLRFGGA